MESLGLSSCLWSCSSTKAAGDYIVEQTNIIPELSNIIVGYATTCKQHEHGTMKPNHPRSYYHCVFKWSINHIVLVCYIK